MPRSDITRIAASNALQAMKSGEMLVGYRFNTDLIQDADWTGSPLPPGLSHQVDAMPVAGPIFYQRIHRSKAPYERRTYNYAHCAGCLTQSKWYTYRSNRILMWAELHRCPHRMETRGIVKEA